MFTRRAPSRAALVTGASSGIGEAFVRALPSSTDLLLAGRDEIALARVAGDAAAPGRRIETVSADLQTSQGLSCVSDRAEAFGVDLFICNAGQGPFGAFLDTDEDALAATVAVNVMAPTVLVRRLLPGMIARAERRHRAGLIVVSSGVAFLPVPKLATYAASKAYDLSLTEALAAELAGSSIDILALCPGATKSRFAERSGFKSGNIPGSVEPDVVARAALRALGRQRTLVMGAISGNLLSGAAFGRAAAAQAIALALRRV